MTRYIALLRAINVGGHNVKMSDLRAMFEALGLSKVETFIASGNVIFESRSRPAALELKIGRHLGKELGYEVATFVRSTNEIASVASGELFPPQELRKEGHALYVAFLGSEPEQETVQRLMACRDGVNDFQVEGREVYWLRRQPFSDAPFALEKILTMPITVRNMTTVKKMAEKFS